MVEKISELKTIKVVFCLVILLSIIFWGILFKYTSSYVEFAIPDYEAKNLKVDNIKYFVYDLNPLTWVNTYERIQQVEKNQGILEASIFIYGLVLLILIFGFEKKILLPKANFATTLLIFITIFIISKIYYYTFLKPFDFHLKFQESFIFVWMSPFVVIFYAVFYKIFKLFFKEEPKLVGKIAIFSDPKNWLFTMCVIFSGIIPVFFIP